MMPGKSMKQVGPTNYISFTISSILPGFGNTVYIGIGGYYSEGGVIDWGDGVIETFDSAYLNHTYPSSTGPYVVKISSPELNTMFYWAFNQDTYGFSYTSYNFRAAYNSTLMILGTSPSDGYQGSSIDVSYLPYLQRLTCTPSRNITSVSNLRNNPSLIYVDLTNCGLSSTLVNNILVQLDQNNLISTNPSDPHSVILTGTNESPTITGQTAKTSLKGKLWTVLTN